MHMGLFDKLTGGDPLKKCEESLLEARKLKAQLGAGSAADKSMNLDSIISYLDKANRCFNNYDSKKPESKKNAYLGKIDVASEFFYLGLINNAADVYQEVFTGHTGTAGDTDDAKEVFKKVHDSVIGVLDTSLSGPKAMFGATMFLDKYMYFKKAYPEFEKEIVNVVDKYVAETISMGNLNDCLRFLLRAEDNIKDGSFSDRAVYYAGVATGNTWEPEDRAKIKKTLLGIYEYIAPKMIDDSLDRVFEEVSEKRKKNPQN